MSTAESIYELAVELKEKEPEFFEKLYEKDDMNIFYFDKNKLKKSTLIGQLFQVVRETFWVAIPRLLSNNLIRVHSFGHVSKRNPQLLKEVVTIDKNNNVIFQKKYNLGKMTKNDFVRKDNGMHEAQQCEICSIGGKNLLLITHSEISYLSTDLNYRTIWNKELSENYTFEEFEEFLEKRNILYCNREKEFSREWNEYLREDLKGIRNLCGEE